MLHLYEIPSQAMEPTLHQGDQVAEIPAFSTSDFKRGSLVAFHLPYDEGLKGIGRVAGLPGERIQLQAGHLIVNGKQVYEPYLRITSAGVGEDFPSGPNSLIDNSEIRRLQDLMYGELVANGALTVPADDYFILGDNRGDSVDSRTYGPIPKSAIFARPVFVYRSKAAGSSARLLNSVDLDVKQQ